MTLLDFEYTSQRNAAKRVCARARKEMKEAEKRGDKLAYHKALQKLNVYTSTDRK